MSETIDALTARIEELTEEVSAYRQQRDAFMQRSQDAEQELQRFDLRRFLMEHATRLRLEKNVGGEGTTDSITKSRMAAEAVLAQWEAIKKGTKWTNPSI